MTRARARVAGARAALVVLLLGGVYVYDGTTHRLYLNGESIATSTVKQTDGRPTICLMGRFEKETYEGKLDDVRIYARALSQDEVRAIYKAADAASIQWPTPPADDFERQWRAAVEAIAPGWTVTQYDMSSIRRYANAPAERLPVRACSSSGTRRRL